MSTQHNTITGLDIGTAGVTALMAECSADQSWTVIGVGRAPSCGLRRGVIVDLESTTAAIARAVSDAEMMAGVSSGPIHANIGGDHIKSVNSRGVVAVARHADRIGVEDVERVLQAARAVPVPSDREVLHVLPQEFLVDDQGGIKDPVGMKGARLEVSVHIVTASALAVGNIQHCVSNAGYELESLTLSSLAAAEGTLTRRERDMGVALVDVGAALTEIVVITDNAVRHTGAVPLGGRHITNDLAIGLRTPVEQAESLKSGAPWDEADPDETVMVNGVGDQPHREVSRRVIAAIVGPRLEEIFQLAKGEIRRTPG
ncbi:MAG: cell division protein FtsA, partial [candidate division Zixibacteria bacterium]|nr:cell division protein FtsA [candidate division Zixibacteria bacterium]